MSINHLLAFNNQYSGIMNPEFNTLKVRGDITLNNITVSGTAVLNGPLFANNTSVFNGVVTVNDASFFNAQLNSLTIQNANNIITSTLSASGAVSASILNAPTINSTTINNSGTNTTNRLNINLDNGLRINSKNPFQMNFSMSKPDANIGADYSKPAGVFFYSGTNVMLPISQIIITFNNFLDSQCNVEIVNQTSVAPPYTPTGLTTICSSSTGTIFNQFRSIDMGTISNLPTLGSNIAVYCTRFAGAQVTQLFSITVVYGS
jgi:hypothetical protein